MPKLKFSELEEILHPSTEQIEEDEAGDDFPTFEFEEELYRLEDDMEQCDKIRHMSLKEFFDEIYAREALVHSHLGESVYLLKNDSRWWNEELPNIKNGYESPPGLEQRYNELTKLKKIWETKL